MGDISEKLAIIRSGSDESKLSGYYKLFRSLVSSHKEVPTLIEFFEGVIDDQTAKTKVIDKIANEEALSGIYEEDKMELLKRLLPKLKAHDSTFASAINEFGWILHDVCVKNDSLRNAVWALSQINYALPHFEKAYTLKAKAKITMAEHYLKLHQTSDASSAISKLYSLMSKSTKTLKELSPKLHVRFQVCRSEIQDTSGKYLEAARTYYVLSQNNEFEAQDEALKRACTCGILAAAKPERMHFLQTLLKDSRSQNLLFYGLLQKMCSGVIVKTDDIDLKAFTAGLLDHQKLDCNKSRVGHNLICISALYNNISFAALGELLEMSAEKAENLASELIRKKRLGNAQIDQYDGIVIFQPNKEATLSFGEYISATCLSLNATVSAIERKYPKMAN